jgi:hypothetical protein
VIGEGSIGTEEVLEKVAKKFNVESKRLLQKGERGLEARNVAMWIPKHFMSTVRSLINSTSKLCRIESANGVSPLTGPIRSQRQRLIPHSRFEK